MKPKLFTFIDTRALEEENEDDDEEEGEEEEEEVESDIVIAASDLGTIIIHSMVTMKLYSFPLHFSRMDKYIW